MDACAVCNTISVVCTARVEELSKGSKREAMGFEPADLKMLVQLLDKYCDAKPPPGSKIPEVCGGVARHSLDVFHV